MNTPIPEFVISKKDLLDGLDKASSDYQVAALTKKNDKVLYDYIQSSSEIIFEYQPTVLSPKKFFFPQNETILEYTPDGKVTAKIEAKLTVLFGIRPCDLNGFKILYEAFSDDHGDPNYLAKAEQSVVIGMDCEKICDKDSFCFKVNSHEAQGGFDLMLYDNNDTFAISVASDKGRDFINKYLTTSKASGNEIEEFKKKKEVNFGGEKPFKNLEKFPEIFEKHKDHPIWEKEGSRCLSCGSCIMVCPTCYCFDVYDDWKLDLEEGKRVRKWDACMLSPFSVIGSGENFREKQTDRLHHRIDRKFNFLMKKHGQSVCTGCGRCVRACLADISPKTIAEVISEEGMKEDKDER